MQGINSKLNIYNSYINNNTNNNTYNSYGKDNNNINNMYTSYKKNDIKNNEPSTLTFNYDYSLAISKCQQRLDRLKQTQNYLNYMNNRVNLISPLSFIFPIRRPVNPNPMLYAYQFLPPPLSSLPEPLRTVPAASRIAASGCATEQGKGPHWETLGKALKRIRDKEELEDELIRRMREDKKFRDKMEEKMKNDIDDETGVISYLKKWYSEEENRQLGL